MRVVVVGGTGTIGRSIVAELSKRHEVVIAARSGGAYRVDITSAASIQAFYREIQGFDALVCAAGDAYLGDFDGMTEEDVAVGVQGKLLGQVRLVLLGRRFLREGGSFTLTSGFLLRDPIPGASNFSMVNGAIEGFVRAAAFELHRSARVNAVSPGLAEESVAVFGPRNPGRLPVPMSTIAAAYVRSVEGFQTGQVLLAE
ncbi:short chain dehydrogenase [Sorangium sp. So ce861]|uniref:short chain dehydrogenase n=1 Tax=Sorangium sp. So ce861 TaxID=3133323 RepID=UPI003F5E6FFC